MDLEKYFDLFSDYYEGKLSFEGISLEFLFMGMRFFLGFLFIGYLFTNTFVGFLSGISFLYPAFFIFIRRKSCYNEKSLNLKDNNVVGYDPFDYWVLGWSISLVSIGLGCFFINSYIFSGETNIIFDCFYLIVSIILVSLVLSPDIMCKVMFTDLKDIYSNLVYFVFWMFFFL